MSAVTKGRFRSAVTLSREASPPAEIAVNSVFTAGGADLPLRSIKTKCESRLTDEIEPRYTGAVTDGVSFFFGDFPLPQAASRMASATPARRKPPPETRFVRRARISVVGLLTSIRSTP